MSTVLLNWNIAIAFDAIAINDLGVIRMKTDSLLVKKGVLAEQLLDYMGLGPLRTLDDEPPLDDEVDEFGEEEVEELDFSSNVVYMDDYRTYNSEDNE